MNDSHKQTPKKMAHGSGHSIATCFGVIGWLFHGILSVITAGLIIMAIVGLLIYAKAKPGIIMEAFSIAGESKLVNIINELDKAA